MVAQHLNGLSALRHQLAEVPPPAMHDVGDVAASQGAQAVALAVLQGAQGIGSSYVSTVPLGPNEDARPLPAGYGDVAPIADALARRASWLHHAWLCSQYGMPKTWRVTTTPEPSLGKAGDS